MSTIRNQTELYYLKVKEAGAIARRGEGFIRKEIARKGSGFPFIKQGRIIRIPKDALLEWLRQNTTNA
ncbi:MAG: helix-turn-helix domain-containing protein [Firmicutes bacterium]|nr:helix-turn-helix domain-containing protein [Bacillota bacterium]